METVVGIDTGTQGTKVVFYDYRAKQVVAQVSAPHKLIAQSGGVREQKAEWWIEALATCCRQVDPSIRKSVVAVGVAGQQHGFVPLNAEGNVLAPVKLWNDTSTVEECYHITARMGGQKPLIEEVGNVVLPGYTASKILWFKKNKRALYDQMAHILLPHDYVNYYLTGVIATECGDASGTALLDIYKRKWHRGMLLAVDKERDLAQVMPPLLDPDSPLGYLGSRGAALGLPEGVMTSPGGGDNMMGAIGSGAIKEGVLTASLGTSGTLYGYAKAPLVDPEGALASFCSSTGGWLPLFCMMNGTVGMTLLKTLFGLSSEEVDVLVERADPGSGGVTLLPFFHGERTPHLPRGEGCFMGMRHENLTRENLFRATLEAAVLGLRGGLERFRALGYQVTELHLVGGGANSRTWRQIVSDLLGLPVHIPRCKESVALGAALQALWVFKKNERQEESSLATIVDEHVLFDREAGCEPGSEAKARYEEVYQRYRRYLDALEGLFR